MNNYCLGFAFDVGTDQNGISTPNRVLLINKQKPAWQKGKLNGLGGKLELKSNDFNSELESPVEAMVREFYEESGIETTEDDWVIELICSKVVTKRSNGGAWLSFTQC